MRTNSWKKGKLKHKILNFNFPHRKNEYLIYSSEGIKFQLKFQKEWKSMPKIPKELKFMPKFRKEWKFMPKIFINSRLVHPFPESRTPCPYHSSVGYGTKEINRGVTLILNPCLFISVFITILMFVSWQCHCDPSFKTVKWVIKANEIVIKLIVSLSII